MIETSSETTSLLNSISSANSITTLETIYSTKLQTIIYNEKGNTIECMNTDYNNYIVEENSNQNQNPKITNILISIHCNKELFCNHYVILETLETRLDTQGSSLCHIMNFYEIRKLLHEYKIPVPSHFNETKEHLKLQKHNNESNYNYNDVDNGNTKCFLKCNLL
jgi:hypothetical protein